VINSIRVPAGTTEITDHAFVCELPNSLRLEHKKSRTLAHPGFTGTPLAISWRHREAKSDEDARHRRCRGSRSHLAVIAGNIIRCQSSVASERKFIQMDSRNISEDVFLCLAGRLRRIQRWYFWRGCNHDLYQQSNRASPEANFSRGVYSDASEAPFRIRGINARLRCSIVPAGTRCIANLGYPALKRWAIFKSSLAPPISEIVSYRSLTADQSLDGHKQTAGYSYFGCSRSK
jgi:hypothetical protein